MPDKFKYECYYCLKKFSRRHLHEHSMKAHRMEHPSFPDRRKGVTPLFPTSTLTSLKTKIKSGVRKVTQKEKRRRNQKWHKAIKQAFEESR